MSNALDSMDPLAQSIENDSTLTEEEKRDWIIETWTHQQMSQIRPAPHGL
jgi:hypothetical protein